MPGQSGGRPSGAPKRAPTMADVARLAGVSMTTVSFVLNERPDTGLREETQQRVREAIETLGYRPNRHARALVLRRSHTIGYVGESLGTPFSGRIISGAHQFVRSRDSILLILDAEEPDELAGCLAELLERGVDGVLVATEGTKQLKVPANGSGVPMILVNCMMGHGARVPSVLPDDEGGGRAAARMLLAAGHRDVACITGDARAWATRKRVKGFRAEMETAGVPPRSVPVYFGDYRSDSGYEMCLEVMRRRHRPTGLFLGNDRMALGAYFALAELGLSVPEDVSVVGYDDQEQLADSLHPALSTVRLPFHEMGALAAELLLSGHVDELPRRSFVQCPPVFRSSVAAPHVARRAVVMRAATGPGATTAQASGH